MSGIDKRRIAELIEEIEDEYGKGAITTLGSKYESLEIPRVSTKIEDLDWCIGGGLPKGRILEIYGPESAGKTSLAYHFCSLYPLALFIDMEGTFDGKLARIYGNRGKQLLLRRPVWGEQAMQHALDFSEAGMPLIVIDSVPMMIPKATYVKKSVEDEGRRAQIAAMMSREIPKLVSNCEKSGTTVIFINQVRDNQNAGLFSDPYITPGGRALKHAYSLRFRIQRKSWLKVADEILGLIAKIRIQKSKVSPPFRECEIPIIFEFGVVKHEEVKDKLKEARKISIKRKKEEEKARGKSKKRRKEDDSAHETEGED